MVEQEDLGMRFLVVEDEPTLGANLACRLRKEGYAVVVTGRSEDALCLARAARYDAILLDVKLRGAGGLDLCRRLRRDGIRSPVLMLGAGDTAGDLFDSLDAGADDCLPKPFSLDELLARVGALVRRAVERPVVLEVEALRHDRAARRAWDGEVELDLSIKELALVELFLRRRGAAVARSDVVDGAWDIPSGAVARATQTVDVEGGDARR